MKKVITLTTDFGDQFATSQLHGVLATLDFDGKIIENHSVSPYSILEGAYGIWQLSKFCPQNTVHLGVIDPGVGSHRAGIIIKTRNFWFVGPDNGLLYMAANKDTIIQAWRIRESEFGEIANTFHGRDVFIKTAIYLAKDKNPASFGCKSIRTTAIKHLQFKNKQVLHIDSYGNIKFFWDENLNKKDKIGNIPIVKTFSDVPTNNPLILKGSSELWELAINQGNAKDIFNIKTGDILDFGGIIR